MSFNSIIRRVRVANGFRLGLMTVAIAGAAACSTTDAPGPLEPTGPTGRVRLVNLITDATRVPVNASLEGLVFTVGLQYAQVAPANLPAPATGSAYAPVYVGSRAFALKRTADTTVTVANISFSISDGQDRTVYAVGGAGGSAVTGFVTTDDNPAAGAAETRLRVVNMSPTAGAVDVFVTAVGADLALATPRGSGLAYQGATAYFTVAPGAYQVRAVPAGTPAASRGASVTINLASSTFAGGTGRTIVLADASTGGAPLRAFVAVDR